MCNKLHQSQGDTLPRFDVNYRPGHLSMGSPNPTCAISNLTHPPHPTPATPNTHRWRVALRRFGLRVPEIGLALLLSKTQSPVKA
jgi:hypothetical protein